MPPEWERRGGRNPTTESGTAEHGCRNPSARAFGSTNRRSPRAVMLSAAVRSAKRSSLRSRSIPTCTRPFVPGHRTIVLARPPVAHSRYNPAGRVVAVGMLRLRTTFARREGRSPLSTTTRNGLAPRMIENWPLTPDHWPLATDLDISHKIYHPHVTDDHDTSFPIPYCEIVGPGCAAPSSRPLAAPAA